MTCRVKLTGKAWKLLREQIYARAQGLCDYCGLWVDEHFDLHHRKTRKQFGDDTPDNCIVTHHSCHIEKIHGHPARAYETGFMVKSHDNLKEKQMFQHQQRWVTL